ncbi:MAG: MarR family winged helix-turn-helix transcriptional regulator [Fimbriimonas sp.]
MPKQNQEPSVAAYVRLIRTSEALHGLVSRGLALEGLTASQFSTLKVLRLKGALAQRDIAKYLLKTGGNVTVVVDNLEKQGYVTRIRDTEDRRIVFVKLTAKGEDLFDRVYPGHLDRIRAAMAPLSEREYEQLVSLLERLHVSEADVPCTPAEVAEIAGEMAAV